jgi:HJR/Mrr/RecB family endonuclease
MLTVTRIKLRGKEVMTYHLQAIMPANHELNKVGVEVKKDYHFISAPAALSFMRQLKDQGCDCVAPKPEQYLYTATEALNDFYALCRGL